MRDPIRTRLFVTALVKRFIFVLGIEKTIEGCSVGVYTQDKRKDVLARRAGMI